jgi:hypothetical protein
LQEDAAVPKTGLFLDQLNTTTRQPFATHRWRLASLSAVVLSLIGRAAKPGTAASGFEAPPVLQAADLAPADLLQGPRFQVEPRVPTDGLLAKFTIRSDFGVFEAEGPGMLGIRVGEIQALDVLEKTEKSDVFTRALAASATRTGKSIATAVTHPVETVTGLPEGLGRFFGRVGRSVKTGTQKAGDYVAGTGFQEGQESKDSGEVVKDVCTAAGNAGSDIIGQNDSRRGWRSRHYYTPNPVLDEAERVRLGRVDR